MYQQDLLNPDCRIIDFNIFDLDVNGALFMLNVTRRRPLLMYPSQCSCDELVRFLLKPARRRISRTSEQLRVGQLLPNE